MYKVMHINGNPLDNRRDNLRVKRSLAEKVEPGYVSPGHVYTREGGKVLYLCNLIASDAFNIPLKKLLPPDPAPDCGTCEM